MVDAKTDVAPTYDRQVDATKRWLMIVIIGVIVLAAVGTLVFNLFGVIGLVVVAAIVVISAIVFIIGGGLGGLDHAVPPPFIPRK